MARNAVALRPQQIRRPAQRRLPYVDALPPLQGFRARPRKNARRRDWRRSPLLQLAFVALVVGQLVAVLWRAG